MPPQGVSGKLAPAQIEVRAVATGVFSVDPVGVALPATAFPAAGEKGGPTVRVQLQNISGAPMRVTLRLSGIAPALDDAVTVRGSAAGAVLIDGPLREASAWTLPAGLLSSGEKTTLRLRFKLKPGLADDAYRGRLDIRQLELEGVPLTAPQEPEDPAAAPSATSPTGTTPATGSGLAATTPGSTP